MGNKVVENWIIVLESLVIYVVIKEFMKLFIWNFFYRRMLCLIIVLNL